MGTCSTAAGGLGGNGLSLLCSSLVDENDRLGIVSGENRWRDGKEVGEDSPVGGFLCASEDLRFLVGDMERKAGLKGDPLKENRREKLLCLR